MQRFFLFLLTLLTPLSNLMADLNSSETDLGALSTHFPSSRVENPETLDQDLQDCYIIDEPSGLEEPVFYDSSPCYYEESFYENAPYSCDANNSPHVSSSGLTFGRFISYGLCKNISVEGSALYWKAARDDRAYSLQSALIGTTTAFSYGIVKPQFHWGWRVKGTYSLPCCSFIDVEYTYCKQSDQDSSLFVPDPVAIAIFSYFPVGSNHFSTQITTKYQRAKARLGWSFCNHARGSFYITGGGSWIQVSEADRLNAEPALIPNYLSQKSWFNGAGLEAGIGGMFNVIPCLGLRAELSGIGAVGGIHNQFELQTDIAGLPVRQQNFYPTVTHLIPGVDICLEAFLKPNFCLPITIAVGYEYHHFFNALLLNDLFGLGGNDKVAIRNIQDIGFGGAYVSLKLNY